MYCKEKPETDFRIVLDIFVTFFKISPLTFGGGFAMIPVLEAKVVHKKKWVDSENIIDIFAVSQSVPGAIAVNAAIFLGYRIAGVSGALAAMFGMLIPAFGLIITLAILLVSFQESTFIQAALKGIRPVIAALIAAAAYKMGKTALADGVCWAICFICVLLLVIFKELNLIIVIISGAIVGIVITGIMKTLDSMHKT